ncbi:MAG: hypothetical protein LBN01_03245 [Endomicrobium sp.]|jgi:hypothetical protein|nr:hypothetical protein [Endomicrobium sp.]
MKKIISILLMLTLISSCEKVNAPKVIQPVEKQIVQPVQRISYLTGLTAACIAGAAVLLFVGYVIYQRYYAAPADLLEGENPQVLEGENPQVEEKISPEVWELLNESERQLCGLSKNLVSLLHYFVYDARKLSGKEVEEFELDYSMESFENADNVRAREFNKEMAERRAAKETK